MVGCIIVMIIDQMMVVVLPLASVLGPAVVRVRNKGKKGGGPFRKRFRCLRDWIGSSHSSNKQMRNGRVVQAAMAVAALGALFPLIVDWLLAVV
jgi:hypothetical protein